MTDQTSPTMTDGTTDKRKSPLFRRDFRIENHNFQRNDLIIQYMVYHYIDTLLVGICMIGLVDMVSYIRLSLLYQ